MKKLKQVELMPLPHGGKREGAGRKPVASELKKPETVTIRVRKDLLLAIEKLKKGDVNMSHEMENLLSRIEIEKLLSEMENLLSKKNPELNDIRDFSLICEKLPLEDLHEKAIKMEASDIHWLFKIILSQNIINKTSKANQIKIENSLDSITTRFINS